MSSYSMSAGEDRGPGNMLTSATMDLQADDVSSSRSQKPSQLRWDRKRKRFTSNSNGAEGQAAKMVRTEAGSLIPASYDSGRYAAWARRRPKMAVASEGNDAQVEPRGRDRQAVC